jgi:hypothetical protein
VDALQLVAVVGVGREVAALRDAPWLAPCSLGTRPWRLASRAFWRRCSSLPSIFFLVISPVAVGPLHIESTQHTFRVRSAARGVAVRARQLGERVVSPFAVELG